MSDTKTKERITLEYAQEQLRALMKEQKAWIKVCDALRKAELDLEDAIETGQERLLEPEIIDWPLKKER